MKNILEDPSIYSDVLSAVLKSRFSLLSFVFNQTSPVPFFTNPTFKNNELELQFAELMSTFLLLCVFQLPHMRILLPHI